MADITSSLTSGLARLNPFSKGADEGGDNEEYGETIDNLTIAGGGRSARQTSVTKELRVSNALKEFLVQQDVIAYEDAGLKSDEHSPALRALVDRPHIDTPAYLTDRSHPLCEYFMSSSHNTYLVGEQLVGSSSAAAYRRALETGARCVEIDAWDNEKDEEEPKVTHGYTLVSHIPFRAVCETIRDVVDEEAAGATDAQGYRAAPIFISLENHCSPKGQRRLVDIMEEVWGERLLSKAIRDIGHRQQEGSDENVLLEDLGSKICLIVEFHIGEKDPDPDDNFSSGEDEAEKGDREEYEARKKAAKNEIIPELAELGVYAQSVKPVDNAWYEDAKSKDAPPHHRLINISEVGLSALMPQNNQKIAVANSTHLMRVFPKGTRITSKNLRPVPYWGIGAQICALNWQTFGAGLQLNEALFSGTDGYVLKPAALRLGGQGRVTTMLRKKLRVHVAGATDIPVPQGRRADEPIRPYLTCSMVHPDPMPNDLIKRKTKPYKPWGMAGFLRRDDDPAPTEPVWDEVLEWEYEDNEMVFLRMLIKSDDTMAANPMLAVTAVRLLYIVPGAWVFIRMLDLRGKETKCSLLVKFEIEDDDVLR
jgi:phosphatidylinositol phospholipase C, delta